MPLDVYKDWLGIPEGSRPPDHYQLLRLVRFEDDPEKIQKNYRKLNAHVRKYATGQYSQESQDLLNELAKAMLCLTDAQRKRDYDESLGREFEQEAGARKPLLDVLVEQGHISADQRREAAAFADARGLDHRDAAVQMKLVDAVTATRALAQELGMSYVDLGEMSPDDSVLDRLPRTVVKRHQVLPLFVDDDVLLVACVRYPEPELEEELRLRFGIPMRGVIATPLAVNQGIARHYAPGMRDESVAEQPPAGASAGKKKGQAKAAGKSAAAPAKSSGPLSPEEKRERKLTGILIILWAVIGSALVDAFVLPESWKVLPLGYLLTVLIPPPVIAWIVLFYWKK